MPLARNGFIDPTTLTQWVKRFIYVQMLVAVVSIVSGNMEYQLLQDYENGVYASQEQAVADGEANDRRQQVIAILYMIVFVISGVLILKWIHRANYNARQLGASAMKFTPGWSVGWFFVPIFSLWKPYQAMAEIWRASDSPDDPSQAGQNSILAWWWGAWLANGFISQAAMRLTLAAEEIPALKNANLVYQASDVAYLVLAVVTLMLVNSIDQAQTEQALTRA
ncbi:MULTISPECIES: DUF4328 domain-containing protein [unclassified Pseudomonas]|uniref:DUF4328 domain-containing protein n=1 Tax=unclassified Pseudomonas TaxID=196821 RepID=UPI00244C8E35|nr:MULTISPECIES: DUF4328 domain-containing protein [unclassified Pseudomonas]MDG9929665.1 DUF4328 domain-containing protein [Pseudomonas sp. GD04042]MDH0483440.1 DUF4328 domain-containing protein [Pseudomonas sp. GD04015]MDH0604757.1 DUF4328 domain-containing protein [Pseudomonas sp. GD03869]